MVFSIHFFLASKISTEVNLLINVTESNDGALLSDSAIYSNVDLTALKTKPIKRVVLVIVLNKIIIINACDQKYYYGNDNDVKYVKYICARSPVMRCVSNSTVFHRRQLYVD